MKKRKRKYSIPKYIIKYMGIILMILGCFYIAESLSERFVPEMRQYTGKIDPKIISHKYLSISDSQEERWIALTGPLEILENVNPVAHEWILNLYKNKKIKFTKRTTEENNNKHIQSYLCKYDWIKEELFICNGVWTENDGTIAVLLCHEYRHSIQSWFKRFRYVISFIVYKEGNETIIENDAYLYEREAFCNIFKVNYPFY